MSSIPKNNLPDEDYVKYNLIETLSIPDMSGAGTYVKTEDSESTDIIEELWSADLSAFVPCTEDPSGSQWVWTTVDWLDGFESAGRTNDLMRDIEPATDERLVYQYESTFNVPKPTDESWALNNSIYKIRYQDGSQWLYKYTNDYTKRRDKYSEYIGQCAANYGLSEENAQVTGEKRNIPSVDKDVTNYLAPFKYALVDRDYPCYFVFNDHFSSPIHYIDYLKIPTYYVVPKQTTLSRQLTNIDYIRAIRPITIKFENVSYGGKTKNIIVTWFPTNDRFGYEHHNSKWVSSNAFVMKPHAYEEEIEANANVEEITRPNKVDNGPRFDNDNNTTYYFTFTKEKWEKIQRPQDSYWGSSDNILYHDVSNRYMRIGDEVGSSDELFFGFQLTLPSLTSVSITDAYLTTTGYGNREVPVTLSLRGTSGNTYLFGGTHTKSSLASIDRTKRWIDYVLYVEFDYTQSGSNFSDWVNDATTDSNSNHNCWWFPVATTQPCPVSNRCLSNLTGSYSTKGFWYSTPLYTGGSITDNGSYLTATYSEATQTISCTYKNDYTTSPSLGEATKLIWRVFDNNNRHLYLFPTATYPNQGWFPKDRDQTNVLTNSSIVGGSQIDFDIYVDDTQQRWIFIEVIFYYDDTYTRLIKYVDVTPSS